VVIPNYNGFLDLKVCLKSVLETNYPNFEVIVVDNGSTDGSVGYIKAMFPSVNVVRHETNRGSAAAYNAGIKHAKGEYVAILNNDMEVERSWLQDLVAMMIEHDELGAVDGKYMNFFSRKIFDSVAAAGRFMDRYGNILTRGLGERDEGRYDEIAPVWVALALFRKDIFEEVGMFDPTFFFGYDEVDLCWRILMKGYEILFTPSVKIYHKSSQTVTGHRSKLRAGIYFHIKKNRIQMLLKNYSLGSLVKVAPVVLLEYLGYILHWLVKGNYQYFSEIIGAILWSLANFPDIWKKHLKVQRMRTISDEKLQRRMMPYCGDLRLRHPL